MRRRGRAGRGRGRQWLFRGFFGEIDEVCCETAAQKIWSGFVIMKERPKCEKGWDYRLHWVEDCGGVSKVILSVGPEEYLESRSAGDTGIHSLDHSMTLIAP